ncbi:hypothetical protein [Winogradskyella sp. MH6]|uniref:hypothetical protein n=1 Tax=Winogradskyella sp. MH6 TaxID=2929510 RepID=UPI001FB2E7E2|nr:hypothetical protein [Winogradskyella sp. MH6]
MIKRIKHFFYCRLENHQILGLKNNDNQLYSVIIDYKNCFKLYINDVVVTKKRFHLVSTYQNSDVIKIKLVGLFNNVTQHLKVNINSLLVDIKTIENSDKKLLNNFPFKKWKTNEVVNNITSIEAKENYSLDSKNHQLLKSVKTNLIEINKDYNLTKIINQHE